LIFARIVSAEGEQKVRGALALVPQFYAVQSLGVAFSAECLPLPLNFLSEGHAQGSRKHQLKSVLVGGYVDNSETRCSTVIGRDFSYSGGLNANHRRPPVNSV